jgi:hypothetical protein
VFKNVATKIALFGFDTTTGAAKTGDAANITAYVSKDYGATTVLGDTSATEQDATNAKGWYLFDVAQAESNADALLFTAKSTTANVSIVGQYIFTEDRAAVADAILDRDMSVGADSGSPSVRTVRQALRVLRNKVSAPGGTMTVTKEDDSTTSWTATLTTDPTAQPITVIDPA